MSARLNALLVLAVSLATLAVAPPAQAAWGDLDPSFAGTGITQALPAGNGYGSLSSTAVQNDGKLVVAGDGGVDFFGRNPMIQRLMPDGSPDPSFSGDGTLLLTSPAALAGGAIQAIALQGDGKIVGIAQKSFDSVLFRVTATGELDTTFAAPNGYLTLTDEAAFDVLVAASGDIFVGSLNTDTMKPAPHRFTTSGAEVGAFASNAAAALNSTTFYGYERVLIEPAGSGLFVVTTAEVASSPVYFAAKFDVVGNIDTAWATNGKQTIPFSIGAVATGAVALDSGALAIGGVTQVMGDSAWTMAKLTPGGVLDPNFAGGGKVELDFAPGESEYISHLTRLPGDDLLAVGAIDDPANDLSRPALRVTDANGAARGEFGANGLRYLPVVGGDANAAAVQSDQKIVVVGSSFISPGPRIPLTARLQQFVPPPAPPVLGAKVTSPKGKKIKAKKLKRLAGTASTTVGSVSKVEIALQRVDSQLLKKKKRCLWLSSAKAKFKKTKAVKKNCSAPRWLKAAGTSSWNYKLKRKLPKGRYVLSVRATASDGSVQSRPTVKRFSVT